MLPDFERADRMTTAGLHRSHRGDPPTRPNRGSRAGGRRRLDAEVQRELERSRPNKLVAVLMDLQDALSAVLDEE